MGKKPVVLRPLASRRNGGLQLHAKSLADSLRPYDDVQYNGITVGTKPLRQLLVAMTDGFVVITANSNLEVSTGGRKYHNWFRLFDGAWVKDTFTRHAVLRPKVIKRRNGATR